MLRNVVWHQVNPATPTSSTSVAEFNSSLVVNTSDALVHDNTLPDSHLEPFDAAKTRDMHDG